MSEKNIVSGRGAYFNRRINISDTVRLAENMPSISDILFTDASAVLTKENIDRNTIYLSGRCNVEVIYLSDAGNSGRISLSLPFDITEECEVSEGLFYGEVKINTCDITPIKGRRCDVSVYIDVTGNIFGEKKQKNDEANYRYRIYKDSSEREFTDISKISFEQTYEYSHPSGVEENLKIVYAKADVFDIKTNHSPAGILVNGFIRQNIVYSTINDDDVCSYHVFTENTSFSRFCEVGYDVSFDEYAVRCDVSQTDTYVKQGDEEEMICMDVSLKGDILLLRSEKGEYICDVFSPEMAVEYDIADSKCCKINKIIHKELKLDKEMRLSEENMSRKLIPAINKTEAMVFRAENGLNVQVNVNGSLMFIPAGIGKIDTAEFKMQENFTIDSDEHTQKEYFAVCSVNEIITSSSADKAYIKCAMDMDIYEISEVPVNNITELSFSEYISAQSDMSTIRIFYDTSPSSVFSIAKETRKSPEDITRKRSENGENCPLIIWE